MKSSKAKFKIHDKTVAVKEVYFKLCEITNRDGICLALSDKDGIPIINILEISHKGIRLFSGINKSTETELPLDDKGRIKIYTE